MTCCRGPKLTLLHRVKERKTPSLSAQASVAPFSLKVAWSGKSLIQTNSGTTSRNDPENASCILDIDHCKVLVAMGISGAIESSYVGIGISGTTLA